MSSNQYPPYDPNQYPYGPPNPNPYPQNTVYPNPYNPTPAPPPPPNPGNPYGGYAAPTEGTPAPNPYGPVPGQSPSGPYGPAQGQEQSNPNNQVYLRNPGAYADPSYPGMSGGQPVQAASPLQQPTPPQAMYGNSYDGPGNMPFSPPPQRPRNGTSPALRLLIIMLAVFVIIAGVGLYAFLSYQNTQKSNANATATAQTRSANNATSTASANQATATQTTNNVNATATAAAGNANTTATAQVIASTTAATATAAAAPGQNPYPPNTGTLAFSDSLTTNDNSLPNNGNCLFKSDGYHISAKQGFYDTCPASTTYSNLAFEVKMTIDQGGCGGMLFRDDDANGKYYLFEVCADGTYGAYRYHGTGGNDYDTIKTGSSPAIHTGIGQSNVIAVVANGATLSFYVNQQSIDQENDTNYVSGVTGLAADGSNNATEVTFTNERIWTF